jgi:hypothetical protein
LFKRFNTIETPKDMERNGLTESEYYKLWAVVRELGTKNHAVTNSSAVAAWLRKNGAEVFIDGELWKVSA